MDPDRGDCRPRRVLYVHQYFNTPEMGGSTRSYEFARRLVADGYEVLVLASWRAPGEPVTDLGGLEVRWVRVRYSNAMGFTARVGSFLKFALVSAFLTARMRSDVVIATSTPLTVALPMVVHQLRFGSGAVFEVRDVWPQVPIELGRLRSPIGKAAAHLLADVAYAAADRVIALSPPMLEAVVERGVERAKVSSVPNGADTGLARSRRAAEERPPMILYAGALGYANDPEYLADLGIALDRLGACRLVILGDGGYHAALRDRFETANASSCEVLGVVPKREVWDLLSRSSLALVTFRHEPGLGSVSPNKAFDALAAGTPPAFNYDGWLPRWTVEAGAGVQLDRDPQVAAAQIDSLLHDHARLGELSELARRVACADFDRDVLYQRWRGVVDAVEPQPRRRIVRRTVRNFVRARARRTGP